MIDFHCHIDLYPEPAKVVERCVEEGLYVLSVTTTPTAWRGTRALEKGRIRTALGLHPQLAHQRKAELGLFEEHLREARYVGEIGLDGAPELRSTWPDQLEVFDRILSVCAGAGGRILSIHSRRASRQVLDRLEAQPACGTPILHWFSGSFRDLERATEMGCWFSVGPAMLRSEKGRALATRMPNERILTESDGPFAQIDGGPAFPWDTAQAVKVLAEIWCTDSQSAANRIQENVRAMLKLLEPSKLWREKVGVD